MTCRAGLGSLLLLPLLAIAGAPGNARGEGETSGARPLLMLNVRGQGLTPEVEAATRLAVQAQLAELDVEILDLDRTRGLEPSCLEQPTCVVAAARGKSVLALVDVAVIRMGPLVRPTVRFFDAHSGLKLVETEAMAPAAGFPENHSFEVDLLRGLETIERLQQDGAPAGVEPSPPPPPPLPVASASPKPAPAAAPEPEPTAGLEPSTASASAGPWPLLGGAVAGVGGALLLGGVGTGMWWLALDRELSQVCAGGCAEDEFGDTHDLFVATGWAAPILMGVGGSAVAAGLITLVVTMLGDDEQVQGGDDV